jgi:glutamate--cysteine ligase|tara:strand:- start:1087 stop:2352 length:1266 start_codon:yes stop_codon:yes gene_type:complete
MLINSKEKIIDYFKSGIKKKLLIGVENEKFLFSKKYNKRANYSEVKKVLSILKSKYNWKPVKEKNNLIGLNYLGKSISLEPGNQIELAGDKLKNIHQVCFEGNLFQKQLDDACDQVGLSSMAIGYDPYTKLSKVPNNPKARYKVMTKEMPKGGNLSLNMMYQTAGTQINLDYISENDFIKKFKLIASLTPISIGIFANSPVKEKKLTKYLSYRSKVWQSTSRGGLPKIFLENLNFEKYADFIINMPLLFLNKANKVVAAKGKTFNDYMLGNIKEIKKQKPKEKDLEVHLSTIFTELRLKKYIEIRSLDACEWDCHCAGPAFYTGLIYSNLEESLDIIKNWKIDDILNAYLEAPKKGLKTEINKKSIRHWGKVFFKLSKKGLIYRNEVNKKKSNETIFLKNIEFILNENQTKAEQIIKKLKN